jgi:glycosyltransferase involved in cell wall biosynthesis
VRAEKTVLIDVKNLGLYKGGIAHWFSPLLVAWIKQRCDLHFILVGPSLDLQFLPEKNNWEYWKIAWPQWLPRPLRHPYYDNVLFPLAALRLSPDCIMSPYHDVRMPAHIPSCISVHDLCFDELAQVYPRRIRSYYLSLLRRNLRKARLVVTVSQTTCNKLSARYNLPADQVAVVYNTLPDSFSGAVEPREVQTFRFRFEGRGPLLFYAGGSEYRKNVATLAKAFAIFQKNNPQAVLVVTGESSQRWVDAFTELPVEVASAVKFVGKLTDHELYLAYTAADVVVYPSLCEGFGRVCLEAMGTGTSLACSNLPVMKEVAGEYAHYFDPNDPVAMSNAIRAAARQGKRAPVIDRRFDRQNVEREFLRAMDLFVESQCVSR